MGEIVRSVEEGNEHLLSPKDESLLHWGDTLLLLHTLFDFLHLNTRTCVSLNADHGNTSAGWQSVILDMKDGANGSRLTL